MEHGKHVQAVRECVDFCRDSLPCIPSTIIQLGTGLGDFAERINVENLIPYNDIPHFPRATVKSHQGNLLIGHLAGQPVVVLQGRFHYYEGYSTKEVAFPIRVLSLLGAKTLILTNAAGGLNPLLSPGSIMIIRDHLNFLGENPLRGANVGAWGPRFPDLSEAYHPRLIKTALDCATRCGLKNVATGTYACIPGPSLETPAETRWLRDSGADAVGMSSVPEVIVARHAGMEVLGLCAISNSNNPDDFQPITLEDIIETAGRIGPQIADLITAVLTGKESFSQ